MGRGNHIVADLAPCGPDWQDSALRKSLSVCLCHGPRRGPASGFALRLRLLRLGTKGRPGPGRARFPVEKIVEAAYVRGDSDAAARELRALASWGIDANDVNPLQAINRCLMPKGLFLTSSYTGSVPAKPVVKLFSIAKQDVFDHFVVDGSKRETLFGRRLGGYRRVLLDREIFSTSDASPVAMPYNLAPSGSSAPAWVIVIPYGSLHDLYGSRDPSMEERLVEELTIHEITHIELQTRDELLPFLAQFGYRVDDYWPIHSVEDLVGYLTTKRLTYHSLDRLVLQRICYPEAFYGSSGNAAHLSALRQIRGELTRLAREIHSLGPQIPLRPPTHVGPAVLRVHGPSLPPGAQAAHGVEKPPDGSPHLKVLRTGRPAPISLDILLYFVLV